MKVSHEDGVADAFGDESCALRRKTVLGSLRKAHVETVWTDASLLLEARAGGLQDSNHDLNEASTSATTVPIFSFAAQQLPFDAGWTG